MSRILMMFLLRYSLLPMLASAFQSGTVHTSHAFSHLIHIKLSNPLLLLLRSWLGLVVLGGGRGVGLHLDGRGGRAGPRGSGSAPSGGLSAAHHGVAHPLRLAPLAASGTDVAGAAARRAAAEDGARLRRLRLQGALERRRQRGWVGRGRLGVQSAAGLAAVEAAAGAGKLGVGAAPGGEAGRPAAAPAGGAAAVGGHGGHAGGDGGGGDGGCLAALFSLGVGISILDGDILQVGAGAPSAAAAAPGVIAVSSAPVVVSVSLVAPSVSGSVARGVTAVPAEAAVSSAVRGSSSVSVVTIPVAPVVVAAGRGEGLNSGCALSKAAVHAGRRRSEGAFLVAGNSANTHGGFVILGVGPAGGDLVVSRGRLVPLVAGPLVLRLPPDSPSAALPGVIVAGGARLADGGAVAAAGRVVVRLESVALLQVAAVGAIRVVLWLGLAVPRLSLVGARLRLRGRGGLGRRRWIGGGVTLLLLRRWRTY